MKLSSHPRIMLVEDDELLRPMLAEALEREQFSVRALANPARALSELHEEHFDLIVCDIVLPGQIDGRQLARMIRARKPVQKAIFISGRVPRVSQDSTELTEYISKPFALRELVGGVYAMLNREPTFGSTSDWATRLAEESVERSSDYIAGALARTACLIDPSAYDKNGRTTLRVD